MTTGQRDRVRQLARGLMTTSAVVLLGIVASDIADVDERLLSTPGPWSTAVTGCVATQVLLAPSVDYSAHDQGYMVVTMTFDEVPPACVGLSYHLALVAQDGAAVFETTGVLADPGQQIPIPAADRPRADAVATTVLSVLPSAAV